MHLFRHFLIGAALFLPGACADASLAPVPDTAALALRVTPAFTDSLSQVVVQQPKPELRPDPNQLKGLSPAEVQRLLLPGSLVRRSGDAQVFQFLNEACVLDLYFYEAAPGEGFAVSHVSARDRAGVVANAADCLRSLLPENSWPDGAAAILMSDPVPPPQLQEPENQGQP